MYKYIVVIVKGAEGSGEDEFRVLAEWRPEARVHGELDITVVSTGKQEIHIKQGTRKCSSRSDSSDKCVKWLSANTTVTGGTI